MCMGHVLSCSGCLLSFLNLQSKLLSTYFESQSGVKRKFEESEAATEDSENPETKAEQQIPAEKKKKKGLSQGSHAPPTAYITLSSILKQMGPYFNKTHIMVIETRL